MTISLLTFILLFKAHQRNSLLYSGLSYDAFLCMSGMKVSRKTFGKYMDELRRRGLLRMQGKHTEIVSWTTCMEELGFSISQIRMRYIRRIIKGKTFTEAKYLIQEYLVLTSFRNQKYFVDKNKRQLQKFRSGNLKSVRSAARQKGVSIEEYVSSIEKRTQVVTGCHYLGGKLGVSYQTANRIINRLHKKNL